MNKKTIRIGTRDSILALKQTDIVLKKLMTVCPDYTFKVIPIKTSGDLNQTIALQNEAVKNLFVKEIESALLESTIDLAVHSMKDLPNDLPEGLMIGAVPEREDNRDVLVSNTGKFLSGLNKGAVIGTGSLRRKIQLEMLRPDIIIQDLRGNIHTRLKKLESGHYDAIVLAAAGLIRSGLAGRISSFFDCSELMPAPCQGALAVEIRKNDAMIKELTDRINDPVTEKIALAEKTFSRFFNGGCKVPIGASGIIKDNQLVLSGIYFEKQQFYHDTVTGKLETYQTIAETLAQSIRSKMHGHG